MRRFFLTLAGVGMLMVSMAQAPVKQSVKILVDQLPLIIRQAYEKDFGTLPSEGWTALVETTADGKRTATKPLLYSYTKKEAGKKVEIKFSPTGEVTSVKGIENPNHQTTEKGNATSDGL